MSKLIGEYNLDRLQIKNPFGERGFLIDRIIFLDEKMFFNTNMLSSASSLQKFVGFVRRIKMILQCVGGKGTRRWIYFEFYSKISNNICHFRALMFALNFLHVC